MMRFPLALFVLLLALAPRLAVADAGVLIPSNSPQPDPKILSLEEMHIGVVIDNGVARVDLRQIFANHRSGVLEGEWVFALPAGATVSDFAVWDGVTRIPGVILERRRAAEIYEDLRRRQIDPGLLQQGEYGPEEARRGAVFSARVSPIPGYGYKRVEMEYHERLPVESLRSYFAIPLRPDAYQAQTAAQFSVRIELRSEHAIRDFRVTSDSYPLEINERSAHKVRASYEASNVTFTEDLAVEFLLDGSGGGKLEVLAYRDPSWQAPHPSTMTVSPRQSAPGFFLASALLARPADSAPVPGEAGPPAPADDRPPRTVIALFDNSLSMQWEKLERSYQALEHLLWSLRPKDRFRLVLFNSGAEPFSSGIVAAENSAIQEALDFVKTRRMRGGTNLEAALEEALAELPAEGETYLALLTDGGSTKGTIHNGRLSEWFDGRLEAIEPGRRPRVYAFAVGDEANLPLMRMLTRGEGVLQAVRSTEPIEFKLQAFLSKIGQRPLRDLRLTASPEAAFDLIYPLEKNRFAGSTASWAGRYHSPGERARFTVEGSREGSPLRLEAEKRLPEEDTAHEHLPRTWARARVDALLAKIEREGEDRETIGEIIRLAKKYKFVTPYTSFLAAPRSLLRPRVIRPGDPILKVHADESIVSVTALFPFGLIKKLRYVEAGGFWQTRFLAPKQMTDGRHTVRLILRDREGRAYREKKTFVIASKPPVVRPRLEKRRYRKGETVRLRASASRTTRTLVARMYGVPPVHLRWDAEEGFNTGELVIPADLPAGSYPIRLTAEDFAHNIGTAEVTIEVVP